MNESQGVELVPIGIEALQMQAEEAIETRRVMERFGYVETTFDQLIADTRRMIKQSTEDMLEIGRAVCCFRELGRGRYGEAIKAIGLSPASAHRLAEVAMKFCGRDHLKPLLTLDCSKVYELALLDDSTLDDLATDPASLDTFDRMSVTELKKSLREAQKNLEAKDAVIQAVQEHNSDLLEKAISRTRYAPDRAQQEEAKRQEAVLQALHAAAMGVMSAINHFGGVLADASALGDAAETHAAEMASWLAQQISSLYVRHGIAVDFAEIVTPTWTRGNAASQPSQQTVE